MCPHSDIAEAFQDQRPHGTPAKQTPGSGSGSSWGYNKSSWSGWRPPLAEARIYSVRNAISYCLKTKPSLIETTYILRAHLRKFTCSGRSTLSGLAPAQHPFAHLMNARDSAPELIWRLNLGTAVLRSIVRVRSSSTFGEQKRHAQYS